MPTILKYDGTNIGRIYFGDVGQRNGLGTGRGIFSHGQDQYLSKGQDATLVTTGDVMMSIVEGRIKFALDSSAIEPLTGAYAVTVP